MKTISGILKYLFAYITICGLVIFPCFIFEESIQMATFGTWPASDARDWELVVAGIEIIDTINTTMKVVNYALGWIQPLSFLSYRSYAIATDFYISGMKAKVFAHEPRALVGHEVNVRVSLAGMKVDNQGDCFLYAGKRISFLFQSKQVGQWVRARGTIEEREDGSIILINDLIGDVHE